MKVGLTNAAGDGVNIEADVEQSISQLWDGFLSLFGKDADSVETKRLLRERTAWGIQRTSNVQVVGMNRPVPLCKIYQPTRLLVQNPKPEMIAGGPRSWMELRPELITVEEFLAQQQNSVITAGAGYGKTTFLNATFLNLLKARNALPILFVLREQGEVDELESFIERLEHLKKRLGAERLVVLVDGYDEISTESRRQVSRLLNKLELQRCGQYLLTVIALRPVPWSDSKLYQVTPRPRLKYFGFGPAWIVRTGTTKRMPSAEATSPPPQAWASGIRLCAATSRLLAAMSVSSRT
jgi:hypothetical protein